MIGKSMWLYRIYVKRGDPHLSEFYETTKWSPESLTIHHLHHFLNVITVINRNDPRYPELKDNGLLTVLLYPFRRGDRP